MKKRIEIYSFLTGGIFLTSGFSKSISTTQFAHILETYGIETLKYLAPLIIIIELCIGLSLIFQYRLRQTALFTLLFLTSATIFFLYGWFVNGVTNCGCFGELSFLTSSPWVTLGRNIVLFYFLVDIYKNSNSSSSISEKATLLCTATICLGAFICGNSYSAPKVRQEFQPQAIEETPLNKFITTSPDSTYWVFAFSYTCPHCLNSIANLQQYETSGVVDKVIGLAIEDTIAERKFLQFFKPQFPIKNIPGNRLTQLTKHFPTSYIIRNDSLVNILPGELPTAFHLKKL